MRMTDEPITVLLADDHDLVREGLKILLDFEEGIEIVALPVTVPAGKSH